MKVIPRPVGTAQPQGSTIVVEIDFKRGIDYGAARDRLEPGFSPAAINWQPTDNGITPRPVLSGLYENTKSRVTMDGIAHKSFVALNGVGDRFLYTIFKSGNPNSYYSGYLYYLNNQSPFWQELPRLADGWISTNSYAVYDTTYIYDPNRDENIVVVTNNEDAPVYASVGVNTAFHMSAFTVESVLLKTAATTASVSERLVFANINQTKGNRVLWSTRGNPRNFTLLQGAGYQDIIDARGPFVKIIADSDGMVLFTPTEIWRGRPRLDAYAFDFFRLTTDIGVLHPYTVQSSPFGILFIGNDYEAYQLAGNQLKAFSRSPGHSRIRAELRNVADIRRMHAVYDVENKYYIIFYTMGSDDFPKQALVYSFEDDAWWKWTFPHEVHTAASFQLAMDYAGDYRWDDFRIGDHWDRMKDSWNQTGVEFDNRNIVSLWAEGQSYYLDSSSTQDSNISTVNKLPVTCTWQSHGHMMPNKFTYYNRLEQVWLEYASPAASALTLSSKRTYNLQLANTGSNTSFAFAPLDDQNKTPSFTLTYTVATRPVLINAQTLVSNDGEFPGAL